MLRALVRRLARRLLHPVLVRLDDIDGRLNHLETWVGRELHDLGLTLDQRMFDAARAASAVHERELAVVATEFRSHTEAGLAAAEANSIAAGREFTGAATDAALSTARRHTEESIERLRAEFTGQLASIRLSLGRLARTTATPGAMAGGSDGVDGSPVADAAATPVIDEVLYLALEDRFRGDRSVIRDRQQRYVDRVRDVADAEHPVIDLGCGRGEWLRVLSDHGIPAHGLDTNESVVAECVDAGLDATRGDLVDHLRTAPDGSAGAVTMFQVVEHLPFPVLVEVLGEVARVLRPGGVLIAETPNALNLRVAASTFWLDPTHERPLHPALLRFLAEQSGFARIEDVFANALGEVPSFATIGGEPGEWLDRFAATIDGSADYALVAWTPAAVNG